MEEPDALVEVEPAEEVAGYLEKKVDPSVDSACDQHCK